MTQMLTEIEDKLVEILQEGVKEIPKGNIFLNTRHTKLPAVIISNTGFDFESLGLTENMDEGKIELEEEFNNKGANASYKLKEKPLQGSVRIEHPPGTSLVDKKDFDVDYSEGSIGFLKALQKDKNQISVKYLSRKRTMTVKGLKVKATYAIDVCGTDRAKVDSIAENVVKTLLTEEDMLVAEGIEMRPLGGETLQEEEAEKTGKIRLKYAFERSLYVKRLVLPIEKIEITRKNF